MTFRSGLALLVALFVLGSTGARSDDSSKNAKLAELFKLTGLDRTLEQRRESCRKQAEAVRAQVMEQMKATFPDGAPAWKKLDAAYTRFLEASQPAWTTDEAVQRYAQLYGAGVTEDELDQIIAFYRSPAGMKDIAASEAAIPQWNEFLAQKDQAVFQKNFERFLRDLKAISGEGSADDREPHPEDPAA
jgi:uncharacterized protein